MRTFVFLLLLANVFFFAFAQGYFGNSLNPDTGRLAQQVHPENIRIAARGEAPPVQPSAHPPALKENLFTCLAWENLAQAQADRLSALLAEKFDDFRQSRHTVPSEGSGWWVFIPALPSKAEADKKVGELKNMGIRDYLLIQDGPNRNALSLGVFSSESGGRDRLDEVRDKGVKNARLGRRPGKEAQYTVEATGPSARQEALRAEIALILPKISSQNCP